MISDVHVNIRRRTLIDFWVSIRWQKKKQARKKKQTEADDVGMKSNHRSALSNALSCVVCLVNEFLIAHHGHEWHERLDQ